MPTMPKRAFAIAPLVLFALTACTDLETQVNPVPGQYKAEIRRTSFGIPHISADDLAGLGYGVGYAAAQDYGCYLADQILKVQSRRAITFGPGEGNANVDSDFAYLALRVEQIAAAELPKQPQDVRDLMEGYAAGYNRWIADTGVSNLPDPCKNAAWVQPITAVDLAAYTLDLALRGSAVAFLGYVGKASPPGANPPPPPPPPPPETFGFNLARPGFGSNGWGLAASVRNRGTASSSRTRISHGKARSIGTKRT